MEDVGELIAAFYDAAVQPGLWAPALQRLGDALGGAAFILSAIDADEGPKLTVSMGVDPDGFAAIVQRFGTPQTNPLVAAMPQLPTARPVARHEVESDRAYFGGELWNEVLRPQQLAHRAIACLHRTETLVCPLGILRPTPAGDFSQQEWRLLRVVLPHAGRAMQMALRLSTLERQVRLTRQSLDQLPLGILIADAHGKIVQINHAAQRLMSAQDGLRLRNGELSAWQYTDTQDLRRALAAAVMNPASTSAVTVRRPSLQRGYVVLVAPLGGQSADELGAGGSGALILLTDPAGAPRDKSPLLQKLFKLTPREAELAQSLLDGQRLDEYAQTRGVSINTVKSQLQAIFAKTDTTRQAELMALLRELPAVE